MNSDDFAGGVAIIAIVTTLAILLTAYVVIEEVRSTAIENNCGRYNPTSGNFEWIAQPRQSAAGEAE